MNLEELLKFHKDDAFSFLPNPTEYNSHVSGTGVYTTDKVIDTKRYSTGPCHAAVRSYFKDETLAIITACTKGTHEVPGSLAFYDWLLNRSPFASSFIVKDPLLSMKNGFVQTIEVHPSIWLGGAQLCRLPASEFRDSFLAICKILIHHPDVPMLPLIYFALGHHWKISENGNFIVTNEGYLVDNQRANNVLSVKDVLHLPFSAINTDKTWKYFSEDQEKAVPNFLGPDKTLKKTKNWGGNNCYFLLGVSNEYREEENPFIRELLNTVYNGLPSLFIGQQEAPPKEEKINYKNLFLEAVKKVVRVQEVPGKNNQQKDIPVNYLGLFLNV